MSLRRILAVLLLAVLCRTSTVDAAPPAAVQVEINFLLRYIEESGCEFYRNGTWHDSKSAQQHLRDKYNYLVARDRVATTEDFIDSVATKSSFSGQAYQVKCAGAVAMPSSQWLRDELTRFRAL